MHGYQFYLQQWYKWGILSALKKVKTYLHNAILAKNYPCIYDWQSEFHWDLSVYWQKRITQAFVQGIWLSILNRQYWCWQWKKICNWNTTSEESRKGTLPHLRWTFNGKSLGLLKTICYKVVAKYFIQNRIKEF